jgi:hypothetical protein
VSDNELAIHIAIYLVDYRGALYGEESCYARDALVLAYARAVAENRAAGSRSEDWERADVARLLPHFEQAIVVNDGSQLAELPRFDN